MDRTVKRTTMNGTIKGGTNLTLFISDGFLCTFCGKHFTYKLVSNVTIIWSIRIMTFFDAKSVPSPHFSPKVFGFIILFVISADA